MRSQIGHQAGEVSNTQSLPSLFSSIMVIPELQGVTRLMNLYEESRHWRGI